jgi:streptomycin 6-kinase
VLKIALPLTDAEIHGEAEYLKISNGTGTVELFAYDAELQAVLIERCVPGANLKTTFRTDRAEAVGKAIHILRRILRPVPDLPDRLIRLGDWFDNLKRAEGTEFPWNLAEKALQLYEHNSRDTDNIFLLHGDLHHDNILSATREPFLAIDPKGIIGHIGYDIGVFLNNHVDWLEWDTRLEGRIDRAVAEFAKAFQLDEQVVREWAFCQLILSRWWMFDEMPGMYGSELGLLDIWKV